MDIFELYIASIFVIFLLIPSIYFFLRFILWLVLDYCGCGDVTGNPQSRLRVEHFFYDRQGNIFTISDEVTSNQTDVYGERIRTQLEKDDKDLPSYEEVMRMSLADFPSPPLAHVPTTPSTDTILMVPPSYAEVDPYASPPAANSSAQDPPAVETAPGVASTSRAAAAAASANPSGAATIAVTLSTSNTSV